MEAIEFFDSIKIVVSGKVVFPNGLKELMGLVDDLIYEDGYYFSEQSSKGVTMDEDKMVSILFGRKDNYN